MKRGRGSLAQKQAKKQKIVECYATEIVPVEIWMKIMNFGQVRDLRLWRATCKELQRIVNGLLEMDPNADYLHSGFYLEIKSIELSMMEYLEHTLLYPISQELNVDGFDVKGVQSVAQVVQLPYDHLMMYFLHEEKQRFGREFLELSAKFGFPLSLWNGSGIKESVDLANYKTERIAPMMFVMVHRKEYDVLGRDWQLILALLYNEENLKFRARLMMMVLKTTRLWCTNELVDTYTAAKVTLKKNPPEKFKYILHALLYEILLQTSFLSTQVKEEYYMKLANDPAYINMLIPTFLEWLHSAQFINASRKDVKDYLEQVLQEEEKKARTIIID